MHELQIIHRMQKPLMGKLKWIKDNVTLNFYLQLRWHTRFTKVKLHIETIIKTLKLKVQIDPT